MFTEDYAPHKADLPDMKRRMCYVAATDYLDTVRTVQAKFSPPRETAWGAPIEAVVSLSIGASSLTLPPDVWPTVIRVVSEALLEAATHE